MIRLLDRYVLGTFLLALGVFLLAFVTLSLSVDFASKLGKFLELRTVEILPFIGRYYLIRLPLFLAYLLPTVVLFAAIFTVIKMARSNEILPVAASGVSLRRMSLPFFGAAVLSTGAIAATDELVLARLGGEISETEEILQAREFSYQVEDFVEKSLLLAREYDLVRKQMTGVTFTRFDADMRSVEIVTAQEGRWDPDRRRWVLFRGEMEFPRRHEAMPGQRPRPVRLPIPEAGFALDPEFTPETLRKNVSFTSRFPFAPMAKLLEEARRYPHVPSCVVKVHARLSFPLSPIVLLLPALPFVMAAGSKSFLRGLFSCFLLAMAYYMSHFACVDLANRGSLAPLPAAWGPTCVSALAGFLAFARMRT